MNRDEGFPLIINHNQYFTISWFIFALMFLLVLIRNLGCRGLYYLSPYILTKCAIFSVLIFISVPLFVLFQILGYSRRKNRK